MTVLDPVADDPLDLPAPVPAPMYPADEVERYVAWAEITIADLRARLAVAGAPEDDPGEEPASTEDPFAAFLRALHRRSTPPGSGPGGRQGNFS